MARVEPRHAREPRVDDGGDAFHGERGLGDVRREDDAPPRAGPEGPLLYVERLVAVQGEHVEVVRGGERADRLGGPANLRRAGEEDEHVPGIIEDAAERPRDAPRDVPIGARLVVVLDGDREGAPFSGQDDGVAERPGERVRVECRGHDGQAKVGAHGVLELAHHGEGDVALEMALVELVEHNDADALEKGIGGEESTEDAFGDEPEAGVWATAFVEPHAVADLVANHAATLAGDERRGRPCRDPPRLEDEDVAVPGKARVEERGRHPRGLAGAGRGAEDEAARAAEARHGVGKDGVDGERTHVPADGVRALAPQADLYAAA